MEPRTERDDPSTLRTTPGESSRKEAERRRDRAAVLLRSADRWERTAQGEERTAAALAWLPPAYTALHDLRLPGSPTNIDHLVIGPTGVFLVDTKVYDGTVRYGNGTLWRGRFPLRRELELLAVEGQRIGAVLDAPVVTAMCFAEGELPRRQLVLEGVRIMTPAELLPFVADRAATVPPHEVERLVQEAGRLARRRRADDALLALAVPEPAADAAAPATVAPEVVTDEPTPTAGSHTTLLGRALRVGAGLALAGVAAFVTGTLLTPSSSPPATPAIGDGRSVSRTTATAAPGDPVVQAEARCPSSGRGWTLGLAWPGLPARAVRYEISWRTAGTDSWIVAGTWSSADQLNPLALNGLPPDARIELRLVALDDAAQTVGEWVSTITMPADAC